MSRLSNAILFAFIFTLAAVPASAQLNGEHLLGDSGVKNASQPEPGFYTGFMYYRYTTDTVNDKNGKRITFDPSQPGSLSLDAFLPVFVYVSKTKVLGANFGMMG